MFRSLKLQKKIVAIWSLFSLLLNMFQPAFVALTLAPIIAPQSVQAEDATPSAELTPTPIPSVAPSAEPSADPSISPSPDPTPEATIEPIASVEPSIEPSSTPTPAPSDTPSNPEPSEDSSPAPPSSNAPAESVTPSSDPTPIPSVTPAPNLNEQLNIAIVDNTAAESIEEFDLTVTETGSATLITDKADYAPTDTAIITGSGFLANTTYRLTVSSTDEPTTSTTVDVTTDESGDLFYAYQLDGIYRPNYKVEAYLASTLVAAVTFTDGPTNICTSDIQGANDQPGQKDLTQMCFDASAEPVSVHAEWSWDETDFSGNNTGDACALFDTDGDGFANYATCVTISGKPATQIANSPRIYSCNDSRADRCAGDTLISGPYTSTCTVAQTSTQPFAAGDSSPVDTTASCTIQLIEVGGGDAEMIDACSFPSQQPNSDPSDCIFAKPKSGKLEVVKNLSPITDSGLFNLLIDDTVKKVDASHAGSTGEVVVGEGDHVVSETAGTGTTLSNYSSSVSCRDLNGTGPVIASNSNGGSVSVSIADGSDVVCTITNTRINNASLTIIKDAVPNDPQDFSFTTTGTGLVNFTLDDDSDGTLSNTRVFSNLAAGTYSVSEQAVAGWVQTSAICDDGSPVNAINLSSGENVTCTFTNTKQPTLTVTKVVTNDNGGQLTASSFPLFVDQTSVVSGATNTYAPGTYTISETQQPGYTQTSLTCDSGKVNPVVLNAGDNVSCTITNDDIAPLLTVIKHVINDNGGTKTASDFTMNVSGTNVSDSSFAGAENPGTTVTLNAGAYSVDEDGLAGYAKTLSSECSGSIAVGETKTCTITNDDIAPTLTLVKTVINNNGGNLQVSQVPLFISGSSAVSGVAYNLSANVLYTASETQQTGYLASAWGGDCASNGTITLQPGDNKTCTITNDDIAPVLTFIKVVNNTYGGTLGEFDFPLYINGNLVTSGVANTLSANTLYTLSESQQYGYTGGTITGDCVNGTITLQPGESKTCYITNNDIQPRLTVTKIVINDNGGTKQVSDFPLFVGATGVTSGVQNGFNAGTYTVSETGISGYAATISGDCDPTTGSVTLAVGDVKSCTITNNDLPGTLIVNKVVINDDGGDSTADDFSYEVNGATAVSFEADGSNSQVVNSGYYTITEPSVSGYTTSYNNCSEVFVPNGGTATCTITNDDQQSYITVIKSVVNDNGGNALPNDFNLTLEGNPVSSGLAVPVNPGTYTAGETLLPGYTFTGFSGDCDRLGDVTVALGQSKTCTLTNDDIAPTITLNKTVLGGSASANSFGLSIGATSVTSGQTLTVNANTAYALNEAGLAGYSFTSLTGDAKCPSVLGGTVTLDEDEDITCTITNIRDTGTIIVHKLIDRDGSKETTDDRFDGENWTVDVDGTSDDTSNPSSQSTSVAGSATFSDLKTGTYSVLEFQKPGYELIDAYCDQEEGSLDGETIYRVGLAKNQTMHCTFVNAPNSTLHGYKWHDQNNNGIEDELGTKLSDWTVSLYQSNGEDYDFVTSMPTDDDAHFGWYWFEHLFPGTYKICETNQTGWLQTYPEANDGCHLVTLPAGSSGEVLGEQVQNATYGEAYNFGNVQYSTVTVTKYSDDNGNGSWDDGEESLSDWGINLGQIEESALESTTDENGEVVLSNLLPGDYLLSEDLVDGWQQTNISCSTDERQESRALISLDVDNTHKVAVTAGSEITCEIGNQAEPKLRIQKSNDATGNKNPGDIVTYTLKVDLTGSSLSEVIVTDVTPDGFVYVPGSWTAHKNGSPLVISEPNYASPGTWNLGSMVDGDVITLTYQAKIDSNQDGGTYNDIAWAEGSSKGWGTVLALGHDSEYVDGIFVGTDVVINKSTDETGTVDIEKEGEVLGAATELPATGAPSLWLLLAISLLITGLGLIFGGKRMKFTGIFLASSILLLTSLPQRVSAADPDNMLSVRVEQPQSPTRAADWNLSFSVLDRNPGSFPSVTCYVKKPAGAFTSFGAVHLATKDVGDSGYCHVDSSIMSDKGTYQFYVTATSGSLSEDSSIVSVNYSSDGPGTPTSYSKDHPESCKYVIKFHTASDNGLTTKVKIYSSDQTNFDTHSGTQVGEVSIGSDQNGEFTHNRSNDCDKTWYYVIRAFDSAGNQSGHRGDEVVTLTTVSPPPTTPALVVASGNNAGTVLGSDQSPQGAEGEVLGEDESVSESQSVEGDGLVAGATQAVQQLAKNKSFWWVLLVIVSLGIIYAITRKKSSN